MFFPSKYPILCCGMNGITHDIKLAVAVHRAGAMPNLYAQNLKFQIEIFKKLTGTTDVVVWIIESDLASPAYIDLLIDLEIKFIEIGRNDIDTVDKVNTVSSHSALWLDKQFLQNIEKLKGKNIRILRRFVRNVPIETFGLVDAVCVKGKESAGVSSELTIEEQILIQKQKTPDAHIISYGGVSGPADVKKYLDLGVSAVGIGTLFASTWESCLDNTVKELMVNKSSKDLTRFADTNQNALLIGRESSPASEDWNRYNSLTSGIQGKTGHIYAGYGIDGITEIRTVQETVDYLMSEIK